MTKRKKKSKTMTDTTTVTTTTPEPHSKKGGRKLDMKTKSKNNKTRIANGSPTSTPRFVDVTELVRTHAELLGFSEFPGWSFHISKGLCERKLNNSLDLLDGMSMTFFPFAVGYVMGTMERILPGSTSKTFRAALRDWDGSESVVERDSNGRVGLLLPEESGAFVSEPETQWTVEVVHEKQAVNSGDVVCEARLVCEESEDNK